ncbi:MULTISPECIES: hypothetical protein [Streptomyces]|uniref:Uncharacterized protein n=1 Tax=Streptomyces yunnanensis TaxID=156453 RepID=A0ABY8ABK8_9ACTN|nr:MULTISPECIES: hypothetical protein [Streptomyces]AJC57803.1 hypothetical protein GZL_05226 [Streptomyces sp. 769]WEB42094.1 hypothetical protein MOV08_24425 [Streptomyces yunnanensis]
MSNEKYTVQAAKERQEEDSKMSGAETPKEKQQQVSNHLHGRAYDQGQRWYGG